MHTHRAHTCTHCCTPGKRKTGTCQAESDDVDWIHGLSMVGEMVLVWVLRNGEWGRHGGGWGRKWHEQRREVTEQ